MTWSINLTPSSDQKGDWTTRQVSILTEEGWKDVENNFITYEEELREEKTEADEWIPKSIKAIQSNAV